jgi:hypothetical protein
MFAPDELIAALDDAGVDYVLIGGLAVGAHGFPLATKDLEAGSRAACRPLLRFVLSDSGCPVRRAGQRSSCGPSENAIAGMPRRGTGPVCQKSEPRHSDAFSSKVSSAGVEHQHVDRPPERPHKRTPAPRRQVRCVRAGSRFRQPNVRLHSFRERPHAAGCAGRGILHRSLHPGLVEQKPPLRVVLIVADAFGDEVEVASVVHRHDGRVCE